MNLYLENYKGKARLAIVNRKKSDESCLHEQLIVTQTSAYFKSDGYELTKDQSAVLQTLYSGDIIQLGNQGLLHRVFSFRENDATIYMTGHCNSNCIMCPTSDMERQESNGMPAAWFLEFLDMLPDNLGHAVITGGEPTMRLELFFEVMDVMSKRFPQMEALLLSNGRSFSSKRLVDHFISACPPMLSVAIPIHGDTAKLHDSITRVQGSFNQTVQGIKNLIATGVAVEIRIVVSRLNRNRLDEMARLIVAELPKVSLVNFIGLETRGNCAAHFHELYLSHRDAFQAMKSPIKELIMHGIDVGIYNFPLCMVDTGFWELCKRSISPEKIRYMDGCSLCAARGYCGGFFNTTLSMVKPSVYPIHMTGGL